MFGHDRGLTWRVDEQDRREIAADEYAGRGIGEERLIADENQVRIEDDTAFADGLGVDTSERGQCRPAALGPVDGTVLRLKPAQERGCAEDAAGRLDAVPAAAMKANA